MNVAKSALLVILIFIGTSATAQNAAQWVIAQAQDQGQGQQGQGGQGQQGQGGQGEQGRGPGGGADDTGCVPIWPRKTGQEKIRALERADKVLGIANWLSKQSLSALKFLGKTAGGAECEPYTMLNVQGQRDFYQQACCVPPGVAPIPENFSRVSGTLNFQLGANCSYTVGAKTFGVPPTIANHIDQTLADLGLTPKLRIQADVGAGAGAGYIEQALTCASMAGPSTGVIGTAMGQLAGAAQIESLSSTRQGKVGNWRWPPWSDKWVMRLTVQGRGSGGASWSPTEGYTIIPKPNFSICIQERYRMFDFIDVDLTQCQTLVSI